MAEMIEQFPVVPRFRMHSQCEGHIVISAFLDRPIIPFGHHHTLGDGLDLLVKLADTINSLPNVEWCDLEQVLLSNYVMRRQGSTLRVRPFTARMRISVPNGVTQLQIENGTLAHPMSAWRFNSEVDGTGQQELPVNPGEEVELRRVDWGQVNHHDVVPRRSSAWAPVRRILCEVRDRMKPVLYRNSHAGARLNQCFHMLS
jgi:hypothetical protein